MSGGVAIDAQERSRASLALVPLHPVLFAAYAVLFLYASNISELTASDVLQPLTIAVLGASTVLLLMGIVLRSLTRAAIVTSAVVVAFFGYGHAERLLASLGLALRTQLVAWGSLVVLAAMLAIRSRQPLPRLTAFLNAVASILIIMALVTIVPREIERAAVSPGDPTTGAVQAGDGATSLQRDIYYLVFDRYGSEWSLRYHFGIDSDLPEWLSDRGFQVATNSHANYRATDFSLAATLNMTYLDHLTTRYGRDTADRTPARAMIPGHAVGRFLQAQGYRYVHLGSWFAPTATNPQADESRAYDPESEFSAVLRETTIVPAVRRLAGEQDQAPTFRERHGRIAEFQFRELAHIRDEPGPKFVFAHVLLPHSPYVFRADGRPLTKEEEASQPESRSYGGQLAYTDARIRKTVEDLLTVPPEDQPIIIVQGDEGPYVRTDIDWSDREAEYLQVRFGILNAMYLPDADPGTVHAFITSVNTFRLIFSRYFGADLPLLPDRSFTWRGNEDIYDFRDVTGVIATPPDVPPLDTVPSPGVLPP